MLIRLPVALTTLLSLAAAVVAIPAHAGRLHVRAPGRKCGSHPSPETISKNEKAFAALVAEKDSRVKAGDHAAGNFSISVNFHVIYANETLTGGYIP